MFSCNAYSSFNASAISSNVVQIYFIIFAFVGGSSEFLSFENNLPNFLTVQPIFIKLYFFLFLIGLARMFSKIG